MPNTSLDVLDRIDRVHHGDDLVIIHQGRNHRLTIHDPLAHVGGQEDAAGRLTAPMPGKIVKIAVREGDQVNAGQPFMGAPECDGSDTR